MSYDPDRTKKRRNPIRKRANLSEGFFIWFWDWYLSMFYDVLWRTNLALFASIISGYLTFQAVIILKTATLVYVSIGIVSSITSVLALITLTAKGLNKCLDKISDVFKWFN